MLWSRNARSLRSARWLRETRLELFRLLVTCGPEGLRAGVIAERPGVQPSSLSFHLAQLTHAGLITQRRLSRQLIYSADYGAMNDLLAYLTEHCCARVGAVVATHWQRNGRNSFQ